MTKDCTTVPRGKQTAERILQHAAELFARQGYAGTSMRQVAAAAGLREPGLYNHFGSKADLYEAVLRAALQPLTEEIYQRLDSASNLRDFTELPAVMTDLLCRQPELAPLLQQALQSAPGAPGAVVMQQWIERLFRRGLASLERLGPAAPQLPAGMAINLLGLLNLTTGYFTSPWLFQAIAGDDPTAEENLARQKQLLHRVMRAILIS